MQITRVSPVTGRKNTKDIDITPIQYNNWANRRMKIQDAMPHLDANDREFIISGMTKEDWDSLYGDIKE
tara:strand:+ start:872 stop:1078 length:207 start_codon:yes stop_codon:yes gene_type:complete